MPKRYGKEHTAFLQGFTVCRNLTILSIDIFQLRTKKNQTVEEFATGAGVPIKWLYGIENWDLKTYISTNLDMLVKVAHYCDVALDVKFASLIKTLTKHVDFTLPETFEEEKSIIPEGENNG